MNSKKKNIETQIVEDFEKIRPAITRLLQTQMKNDMCVHARTSRLGKMVHTGTIPCCMPPKAFHMSTALPRGSKYTSMSTPLDM